MGAWMSVHGTTDTVTVLAATEVRYFLCYHYKVNPPNLQKQCDGCMQTFLVCHALSCPHIVIVIARYYDIRDNIIHLTK